MDYTIEQMENSMTLVFNKNTGNIKGDYSGVQDMDTLYGEESQDYKLIWDSIILTRDNNVLNNIGAFKVNANTRQLEMKPEAVSQYPIAAQ